MSSPPTTDARETTKRGNQPIKFDGDGDIRNIHIQTVTSLSVKIS